MKAACLFALTLPFVLALAGCGSEDVSVDIQVAALIGDAPVGCGTTYEGVGTGQELTLNDARVYIHDVELLTAAGEAVSVALDDNAFQAEGVVLLDYEDGSAGCDSGNAQLNDRIQGTVPEGDYVGVRFKVGVPFDLNHQDAILASAPLNLTAMHWGWQAGYKFVRLDGDVTGLDGWRFHLGSTACDGDARGNVMDCANPNRVEVELMDFDIAADSVRFDVGALLDGIDLTTFTEDTPKGCMASPDDPDCALYFEHLGLPHASGSGQSQTVFTKE